MRPPAEVPAPLALGFPYTAADTPELRDRVGADLAGIAGEAARLDRRLVALVLTGGYARGEGTAVEGGPVNDYDLVAVRSAPRPPPALYRDLGLRWTRRLGLEVDLAPAWEARLLLVPRTIFWYEVREAGRTILGPEVRTRVRPIDPARLPMGEAVRLLFNRGAGLLAAAEAEPDPFLRTLQAVKAHLACGEALLVVEGRYHWSLRERVRRVREVALPEGLQHLPDAVEAATIWKLSTAARADPEGSRWTSARNDLLDTLGLVLGRTGRTLARELDREPMVSRLRWVARTGRLAPAAPRARTRAATLELLLACDGAVPRGSADLRRARALLGPFGVPPAAGFGALRDRLLAARRDVWT